MFGFSDPTVKMLIQELPNARKCNNYLWKDFDNPLGEFEEAASAALNANGSDAMQDSESQSQSQSLSQSQSQTDTQPMEMESTPRSSSRNKTKEAADDTNSIPTSPIHSLFAEDAMQVEGSRDD